MASHSKRIAFQSILVLIVACLCFLPTSSSALDTPQSDNTATYVSATSGIFLIATYRHHAPLSFLTHHVYALALWDRETDRLPQHVVRRFFLLLAIQLMLLWLMLMPLKYGCTFVELVLDGTHFIPERRYQNDAIHRRRSKNDQTDSQGSQALSAADAHFGRWPFCRKIFDRVA